MNTADQSAQRAAQYAAQAAEVAAKLKVGTWNSVQALAVLSIAHCSARLGSAQGSSTPSR